MSTLTGGESRLGTLGVSALRSVIAQLGDVPSVRAIREFWDVILQAVAESGFAAAQDRAHSAQLSLQALTDFLEAGLPETEAASVKARIAGPYRCAIPVSRLPGHPDDPSTPLGLCRLLDPFWLRSEVFTAHLPHTLSLIETILQGPAVVEASIRSAHPATEESAILEAREAIDEIHRAVGEEKIGNLCRAASFAVDEAFLQTPFLSLDRPEDFYRNGCRFYGQGELDFYKCGVTSGFVIPEEYYGRRIYETHGPGITRDPDLVPGSFGLRDVPSHAAWANLVTTSVRSSEAKSAPLDDHPYRPLYFDSALDRIESRGGRFCNLIDVERTGLRLRERAEYWEQKGLLSEYLADASAVLRHFLLSPLVSTHFVRSLDSAWRDSLPVDDEAAYVFGRAPIAAPFVTSLLSDRVCVYTARGPLRAINRGFWVNPPVLDYMLAPLGRGWEVIPFYLLGLTSSVTQKLLDATGNRRTFWLDRFIHAPTRGLFREESRVRIPDRSGSLREVESMSMRIIEELLRPDLTKILRPEAREFLTLTDLPGIFGRSYGRLRHWINDYNLGSYSNQGHEHRFSRSDLEAFVRQELAGKRGFGEKRIRELERSIDDAFKSIEGWEGE